MKRDWLKSPTTIHGPSGLKFLPLEKANSIAVWKVISHRVTYVSRGSSPSSVWSCGWHSPEKGRPYDILINFLKLWKACGIDAIPNECLKHLPRKPLAHLTHLFNHCLWLTHFPSLWKEAKAR
jgi:hypothetical protein